MKSDGGNWGAAQFMDCIRMCMPHIWFNRCEELKKGETGSDQEIPFAFLQWLFHNGVICRIP